MIQLTLFIGQSDPIYNPSYAYSRRYQLLEEIKQSDIPVDMLITGRKFTYSQYLTKLASYKFILNPLGTGDFINLRFYESLKLGCIPVQQITDEMYPHYSHNELAGCCTFKSVDDIRDAISTEVNKVRDFYIEDYFEEINLKHI